MTKSKVFLYFCLSFIAGIGVNSFLIIPTAFLGVIFIVGIILIITWWRYSWMLVILGFCFILAVFGGYWYQAAARNDLGDNHISGYNDYNELVSISGVIGDEPDTRTASVKYEVESQSIDFGEGKKNARGKFLVTTGKYPQYHYGDTVEFQGKLKTPMEFPDFSYKDYLSRYDVYSLMYYPKSRLIDEHQGNQIYSRIFSVKNLFQENISKILPEPHASFLSGLLLGVKKQIPQDLLEDFNRTGTTHIVAISGYNITIIAFLILSLLLFLGIHRRWSFWISAAVIILFSLLTGASASVVRASIMGILILVANRLGRLSRITNALVFSGVLMLVFNPKLLKFDVGFQLSFLATIGLVFFSGEIGNWLDKLTVKIKTIKGIAKPIKDSLSATLSAQIFVVPVIAYSFGSLSLVSPLANVLILPLIPLTMLIGFVGAVLGFIWLPLAKLIGYLTWVLLSYEIKVVEILSNFSLASIEVKKIHWLWVAGYYVFAIAVYYRMKNKKSAVSQFVIGKFL